MVKMQNLSTEPMIREENQNRKQEKISTVEVKTKEFTDLEINQIFRFFVGQRTDDHIDYTLIKFDYQTYFDLSYKDRAKSILNGLADKRVNGRTLVSEQNELAKKVEYFLNDKTQTLQERIYDLLIERAFISSKRAKNKELRDQCSAQFNSFRTWCGHQYDKNVLGIRFPTAGIDNLDEVQDCLDKLVTFEKQLDSDLDAFNEIRSNTLDFFKNHNLQTKFQETIECYYKKKDLEFQVLSTKTTEILKLEDSITKTLKLKTESKGETSIQGNQTTDLTAKQVLIDAGVKFKTLLHLSSKINNILKVKKTDIKDIKTFEFDKKESIKQENQNLENIAPLHEDIKSLGECYYGFLGYFWNGDVQIAKSICDYQLNHVQKEVDDNSKIFAASGLAISHLDNSISSCLEMLIKSEHHAKLLTKLVKEFDTEWKIQQRWIDTQTKTLAKIKENPVISTGNLQDLLLKAQVVVKELTLLKTTSEEDHLMTKQLYEQLLGLKLSTHAESVKLEATKRFQDVTNGFKKKTTPITKKITENIQMEKSKCQTEIAILSQMEDYLKGVVEKIQILSYPFKEKLDEFADWLELKKIDREELWNQVEIMEELNTKSPPLESSKRTRYFLEELNKYQPKQKLKSFANTSKCLLDLQELLNKVYALKRSIDFQYIKTTNHVPYEKRLQEIENTLLVLEDAKIKRLEEIESEIKGVKKKISLFLPTQSELEENEKEIKALLQEKVDLEFWINECKVQLKLLKSQKVSSNPTSFKGLSEDCTEFDTLTEEIHKLLDEHLCLVQKLSNDFLSYSTYTFSRDGVSWNGRGDKEVAKEIVFSEMIRAKYLERRVTILGLWHALLVKMELEKRKNLFLCAVQKLDFINESIENQLLEISKIFDTQKTWLNFSLKK